MSEDGLQPKAKKSFRKMIRGFQETAKVQTEYIPKSVTFTKLELPILYSNLILIEDMKFENSNYFIRSNGFISKKLKMSSLNHDPFFEMSSCVFRIYPKTYNANKYKVLDYIQTKCKINEEELNFKFSAEMFNNLDIVMNKFSEPVRYGDIIMLMHENTRMFVKFIPQSKKLTLSNHDSEATLFSVEPAGDIMLNDNQILKTGQPIRLKIAWFTYANQNLYFSIRFPYTNDGAGTTMIRKDNESMNVDGDNNNEEEAIVETEQNYFDIDNKIYLQEPELIVEENSSMRWRIMLYSPFTTNENLLIYGDFVNIFHCNTSSILTVGNIEEIHNPDNNRTKTIILNPDKDNDSNSSFDLNDSGISLINNKTFSDIDNEEGINQDVSIKANFFLKNSSSFNLYIDVNSTWILENIFPLMKRQSFIRYYEEAKLDTYRMAFRIKNFKTNKILTIVPIENNDISSLLSEEDLNKKGYLRGGGGNSGKLYKFTLVEDKIGNSIESDEEITNEEYQYSLFAFQKTIKSSTFYSSRPEKNDFLRLYHVATQSYLKIVPSGINEKNSSFLTQCVVTLTKYPEEREVFKISPIDSYSQWKFRFLNSLYYLLQLIISHIEDSLPKENEFERKPIKFKTLQMTHFILDKLLKFTMNKFINKFSNECGFNSVVKNRQVLISNFGFTRALFNKYIYNFWLHDDSMEKLNQLNNLLYKISSSEEALNSINNLNKEEKLLYAMYKYTESIFDFSIVYCKDNEDIKTELYEYLHVYFYFFNIIESCLYGMIEIFKDNQKLLHGILKDCKQKESFQKALSNIFGCYFPNYSEQKNTVQSTLISNENEKDKEKESQNYTIIDLIFEFIKISRYDSPFYNNYASLNKEQHNCNTISLISRDKYFSLLNSMVLVNNGANILENQRSIIEKMIVNEVDNDDNFILKKFLENKGRDYPPCLKELLYNMAEENPDDNIQSFLSENDQLQIDNLFPPEGREIDQTQLSANIKLIMYLIAFNNQKSKNSDSDEIAKIEKFTSQVKDFFMIMKNYFMRTFIPKENWRIDFLNKRQVGLVISSLQFLKVVYENNIIDVKTENNFIVRLMKFLTRNFRMFQEKKFSNLIHSEMNKKQLILNESIAKCNNINYISIAESWLKVYLVFKNVLTKLIEDENSNEDYTQQTTLPYFSTLKKTVMTTTMSRRLATSKTKQPTKEKSQILVSEKEPLNEQLTSGGNSISSKTVLNKQSHKYLRKTTTVVLYNDKNDDSLSDSKKSEIIDNDSEKNDDSKKKLYEDEEQNENIENEAEAKRKTVNFTSRQSSFLEYSNYINHEDYNDISKVITSEDEKTHSKNAISKNIINIFKYIIKKNISILVENFYDYYKDLEYEDQTEFEFDDFIEHCVPNLDSGLLPVNKMIRNFSEKKISSKFPYLNQLSNFNLEFDDKNDKNLNFIQNLIIAFNITDDIEMQEAIMSLIYNYFNQRKVFFRNVATFNEHIITFRNLQNNPFNDKVKIKTDFKKFYQSYEKSKHEYSEEDFDSIEDFLTLLLKNLFVIFRKIFNYWKYEFRTLSLENANKYYKKFEENENLIKEIEKLISIINYLENLVYEKKEPFTKEFYLKFIDEVMKIFYFARKNINNNVFSSLLSILNENGVVFNKMYFALMRDFMNKGKAFGSSFSDKFLVFYQKQNIFGFNIPEKNEENKNQLLSIKNKFFGCLFLLITFQFITIPKNEKATKFLMSFLKNDKELMKYDSICSFLIILYVSDVEKANLSLKYFSILEQIKQLNRNECFGDFNTRMDLNSLYPNTFSNLYLDIVLNVMKFVISKGHIINESNLDEILVENVLFLIKKCEHDFYFSKEDAVMTEEEDNKKGNFLSKLIRIINYFNEIASLNNIFLIKIDPKIKTNFDNEINQQYAVENKKGEDEQERTDLTPITDFFPKPHQLYYLFSSNLINVFYDETKANNKAFQSVKVAYEIYKYFVFYILTIDINYFKGMELLSNFKTEKEQVRNMIQLILYGELKQKPSNFDENENNNYDFLEMFLDKTKDLKEKFIYSSFFLLLNQFTFKLVDINQLNINEIFQFGALDINHGNTLGRKATKNLATQVATEDESEEDSTTEIGMRVYKKTGENIQVNYYIYKKLKMVLKEGFLIEKYSYYKKEIRKLNHDKLFMFKKMLYENKKELNSYAKKESGSLIYYLLILLNKETKMQYDQIFYTFLNKIVDFIYKSVTHRLSSKTIKLTCYLFFILKEIIKFYEINEDDLKTSGLRKRTLREIQILIERTGIVETSLKIVRMYEKPEVKQMLPYVYSMFCKLLKKGNFNSQQAFYTLFTMKNKFEPVFNFMLNLISNKMNYIVSNKSKILRHKIKKISFENKLIMNNSDSSLDSKILQFLQLLCENHNRKLQLFLHSQTNYRKSYDLVSQTQHYLTILFNHFEPFLFEPLVKCFDLLIEFIQGPCLENQVALINSKLLITINDILKYYIHCENTELCKQFPDVVAFKLYETKTSLVRASIKEEQDAQLEINFYKMSTPQISLLTFKSSILLLALVESRTKEDPIYHTIKNIIKPERIKSIITKIYFEYLSLLCKTNELNDYVLKLNVFNKAEDVEDNAKTIVVKNSELMNKEPTEVNDYLIIESGFFLYFLYLYIEDYDNYLKNIIRKPTQKKNTFSIIEDYFKNTIFDSLITFIFEIVIAVFTTFTTIASFIIYGVTCTKVKMFNILRRIAKHKKYTDKDSEFFYEKYTESIEILRDEKVYKIYFYLFPFCKSLNKFEKTRFLEGIDRTNTKSKLMNIMKFANKLKFELENDYMVKNFAVILPICGVIFKSVELWKDLSLLINIIQNIFNIWGVYKVPKIVTICINPTNCAQIEYWYDEKSFFNMTSADFKNVVSIISYIQCSLACLIFIEFMFRKVPTIYSITEEEVDQKNLSNLQRKLVFIKKFCLHFVTNFEVIYYTAYVVLAFMGTIMNDFYFAFLLLEVVQRLKTLRNVCIAIQSPYKDLFLMFILWFMTIYFFAIFGYVFFRKDFPNVKDCNSLVRCIATLFYENNKMDNGIGGYLISIYSINHSKNPFIGRFWYDELFNIVLKILLVQMISGIIIDKFAELRTTEMEMIDDMKNICTICSLNREEIVKLYEKYGKSYSDHIDEDHNIFNYIFYIIYLYKKDVTEFTGTESYVYELAFSQKDVTWFPIDKLYIGKPDEIQAEEEEEESDDD